MIAAMHVSSANLLTVQLCKNLAQWVVTLKTSKNQKPIKLGCGPLHGDGCLSRTIRYMYLLQYCSYKAYACTPAHTHARTHACMHMHIHLQQHSAHCHDPAFLPFRAHQSALPLPLLGTLCGTCTTPPGGEERKIPFNHAIGPPYYMCRSKILHD